MKILHLTLRKKWFDMIASGEKKEEYREIKPSMISKFSSHSKEYNNWHERLKEFDYVHFYNGWACSQKYPNFKIEFKGIRMDEGREEWGAEPGNMYFVIELGEIIK